MHLMNSEVNLDFFFLISILIFGKLPTFYMKITKLFFLAGYLCLGLSLFLDFVALSCSFLD